MRSLSAAVLALASTPALFAFDGQVTSHALLPLVFEPNHGQAPAPARFLVRRTKAAFFLTDSGFTLAFSGGETLTFRLLGASEQPQAEALEPTAETRSIQIGDDPSRWAFGLPVYRRVRFRDVYPRIDLEYRVDRDRLEYDFIVRPGGDPRQIRFEIDGGAIELTEAGAIRVQSAAAAIEHSRPFVYQGDGSSRLEVAGEFRPVGERTFAFELGRYDAARELVIDPEVPFASDAGGPGNDVGFGLDFGPNDELWACGEVDGASFLGASRTGAASQNIYVLRLSPDNTPLDTLITGGSRADSCGQIDADDQGGGYGFGSTDSNDFPGNPVRLVGGSDLLLFGVGPAPGGGLQVTESRTYGGPTHESFRFARRFPDGSGAHYLLGGQTGGGFPGTGNGPGGTNAFLLAINEDHQVVATDFVGGPGDEYLVGCDLASGVRGERWRCAGSSNSRNLPGISGPNPGGWSAFLLFNDFRLGNWNGGSFYSTPETTNRDFFVQAGRTFPRFLDFAEARSTAPPPPPLLIGGTLAGQGRTDGYVALVDENGEALATWMRRNANVTDLAIDGADMIGVFGHLLRGPTRRNIFLSKLDPYDGLAQFDDYVHPSNDSFGQSIAVDPQGQLAMTGGTASGFQRNGEPLQQAYAGGSSDAFLLRARSLLLNPQSVVDAATFAWHPVVGLGLYGAILNGVDSFPASPAPPAPDGRYPTEHGGIAVEVDGVRAPIILAGPQTNFRMTPRAFDRDAVEIRVRHNGTRSNPVHLPTAPAWPTIYQVVDGADGWAAALRGFDGSAIGPTNGACDEPVVLFGNNFGRRSPAVDDPSAPFPFDRLFEAPRRGIELHITPAGGETTYPADLYYFGGGFGTIMDHAYIGFKVAFWNLVRSLADTAYTLTLEDAATGRSTRYYDPLGRPLQPIYETTLYLSCP